MKKINEQKTAEAVARMREMGMMPEAIQMFKQDHLLQSEGRGFLSGILYDLDERARKAVSVVSDNGGMPYHVIKSFTEVGTLYAVLYVSHSEEEWDMERMENDGSIFSYVYNATNPSYSEYGYIGIRPANGGLERIQ